MIFILLGLAPTVFAQRRPGIREGPVFLISGNVSTLGMGSQAPLIYKGGAGVSFSQYLDIGDRDMFFMVWYGMGSGMVENEDGVETKFTATTYDLSILTSFGNSICVGGGVGQLVTEAEIRQGFDWSSKTTSTTIHALLGYRIGPVLLSASIYMQLG